ncbi:hypothetical protein GGR53DRAFT_488108 [Hypoxylon sp. FL1150]|nr:hypothetical protein GGR53DRAFT_488108 [Hypoxylon sp. FL1150]
MATTATGIPEAELEEGQLGPGSSRKMSYISDITFKIIPSCALILIFFAAGGILLATLGHNEPIPHQGTVVISILLLTFFVLFFIGAWYLYIKKRYPPLTKGPDAPDRPPPPNESFRTMLKRILTMLTEIHHRLCARREPGVVEPVVGESGVDNHLAELEALQRLYSQPPPNNQTNRRSPNMTENRTPGHTSYQEPTTPYSYPQSHPGGPRAMPSHKSRPPYPSSIPEDYESYGNLRSPGSDHAHTRTSQYHSHTRERGYHERNGGAVSPMSPAQSRSQHNYSRNQSYPSSVPAPITSANLPAQTRDSAYVASGQSRRRENPAPSQKTQDPRHKKPASEEPQSHFDRWASHVNKHVKHMVYGSDTYLVFTPENLCELALARALKDLDEKSFDDYPPGKSIRDIKATVRTGEHIYPAKPSVRASSLSVASIPTRSHMSTSWDSPFNIDGDIWIRNSSLRSRPESRRSGKESVVDRSGDEHIAGLGINPSDKSTKRTSSKFSSKQEQPQRSRNRRYTSPSQSLDNNDSVIFTRSKASPEKPPVLLGYLMFPPTPPSTASASSTMTAPRIPPKTEAKTRHSRHRTPEVSTDYETDNDEDSFPGIRSVQLTPSTSQEKLELPATARRKQQRRHRQGEHERKECPAKPAEKTWCYGQGRRHQGDSYRLPEVPPRSSSIGFRSHFGIGPRMPSESSKVAIQSD